MARRTSSCIWRPCGASASRSCGPDRPSWYASAVAPKASWRRSSGQTEPPHLSLRRTDVTQLVASVENRWSGAVFTALLSFVAATLLFMLPAAALKKEPLTFVTSAGKHEITVEIADNDAERATGLMFRRSIGPDEGMLFIYDREDDI